MILDIVVEADGEGFHAFCPMLPGLHVAGDTEQEALKHAGDALSVYVASMIKHGDPLPPVKEVNEMEIDYEALIDDGQQLCALLDAQIEEKPDDEELKELLMFLAARCAVLMFLRDA